MKIISEQLASTAKSIPQTLALFGVDEEGFQILESPDSDMVVAVGAINGEEFAAAMIPSTLSVGEDGMFSTDGPIEEMALDEDEELISFLRSTDLSDGSFPTPETGEAPEGGHYWDKVIVENGVITLVGFNLLSSATPWVTIHDKLDNGNGEFDEYMKRADDVLEAKGFIRHFGR